VAVGWTSIGLTGIQSTNSSTNEHESDLSIYSQIHCVAIANEQWWLASFVRKVALESIALKKCLVLEEVELFVCRFTIEYMLCTGEETDMLKAERHDNSGNLEDPLEAVAMGLVRTYLVAASTRIQE